MSEPAGCNRVFICLGSNVEPEVNLPAAVALLAGYGVIRAASTVYETLPVGDDDQANFLNAAVLLETTATLGDVREQIVPAIESALGRIRLPGHRNGPRTIDLDVALFNDAVTGSGRRALPDPDIDRYAFVAIPLAELQPDYVHPISGKSLKTIAGRLSIAAGDMCPRDDVRLIPG